jgi:hypothetical protein
MHGVGRMRSRERKSRRDREGKHCISEYMGAMGRQERERES